MVRKEEEGIQPFYRSKEWNRTERMKEKERKKRTWVKLDGSEAVFFVDASQENELAKKCRKEFRESGLKVKIVETSARSVKRTLVKSNPFKKLGCNNIKCQVYALGREVDCKSREVLYEILCAGTDIAVRCTSFPIMSRK